MIDGGDDVGSGKFTGLSAAVTERAPTASRAAIAETVVDPASPCADAQRRIQRIAATLDAVPYVTLCNLANLNTVLRGGWLDLIEVRLLAVGAGPSLDFADAAAFLAEFDVMIEKVRRRRLQ